MVATPDPLSPSSDYNSQISFWNMVNAILGGETAIKAATTTYLPKFEKESQATYNYRLSSAPFTNIYADISKNLASKPFSKELRLADGTPEQYHALAENIDGQGNNLHVFAAGAFKSALDKAISWLLVDFTRATQRVDGRVLTRAEERAQGLRPYWVSLNAERVLAIYSDFIGGVEVIHHARIYEPSKHVSGFKEVLVERIRVFERAPIIGENGATVGYAPATFSIWERQENQELKTSEWVKIDEGEITIGVIPLVPVILTKRTGASWVIDPPLRDLATMQITEYRQEANLEWIKVMTCFPMVAISGMSPMAPDGQPVQVTVGPNTVMIIPQNTAGTGPAGEIKFIEPSSQSIVENRAQLELTRKEMRDIGLQPLAESNLTVVTTANVSRKASSAVQAWALLFKDALESALKLTAMWLGDSTEPEVVIHTDFAIELESGNELDALLKAERQGIYSKRTVREEFRRRNVVSIDADNEEEELRLAKEQEGLDSLGPTGEG